MALLMKSFKPKHRTFPCLKCLVYSNKENGSMTGLIVCVDEVIFRALLMVLVVV